MKDLMAQLDEVLKDVSGDVEKASREAISEVPKEAVRKLRAGSPKREKGGQRGRYARGWRAEIDGTDAVVYNATDPGLTHLLEKGHATSKGGRARAIKHIEPVEEWAAEELPRRILERLDQ